MTQAKIETTATSASKYAGDYLSEDKLRQRGFTAVSFNLAHEYFNAIIRHVALSEGITVIDLANND